MDIKSFLKEYSLEIDDVRWYLSLVLAERIQSMIETPEELTKFIWSSQLSDELYNMEERFIKKLQDQIDEDTLDESHLRDMLSEMEIARKKRFGY